MEQALLRHEIVSLVSAWEQTGLPGRQTLHEKADALLKWRSGNGIPGLWQTPVRMLGATLDDAWGVGIELILKYARVLGCDTRFAGLLLPWQDIAAACHDFRPDYLGLTVLQFDTEDDLVRLRKNLSGSVKVIAGGPIFKHDSAFQARTGIDFAAGDLTGFLKFMMAEPEKRSLIQ